jgi:hypothetical protein
MYLGLVQHIADVRTDFLRFYTCSRCCPALDVPAVSRTTETHTRVTARNIVFVRPELSVASHTCLCPRDCGGV